MVWFTRNGGVSADPEIVSEDHAPDELEKNQLYEGMQEFTTLGHAVLCVLASYCPYRLCVSSIGRTSKNLYRLRIFKQ